MDVFIIPLKQIKGNTINNDELVKTIIWRKMSFYFNNIVTSIN